MRPQGKSPLSLDAIGRGMIKKPHPYEIRIPQSLICFTGSQLPSACDERTKTGKPVRGRGRGTASISNQTRRLTSRERLIGRTLDSKKMDVKLGKGLLMEKFLGQQALHFNINSEGTYSQSSGHSRRTCPPNLRVNSKNVNEWPDLEIGSSRPTCSSLREQKCAPRRKKIKEEGCGQKKCGTPSQQALKCDDLQSASISSNKSGTQGKSESKDESSSQFNEIFDEVSGNSETANANNNCSEVLVKSTSEASNADLVNAETKGEKVKQEEASNDAEKNSISLSDLAKQIASVCNNVGETKIEGEEEGIVKENAKQKDESCPHKDEQDINYKLFVRQEEYQPGDVSPLSGPNVLQVEGLPAEIKDEDISDLFFSCGTVSACKVLRDADTKLCIGIAYVRLEESAACADAVSVFHEEHSPFSDVQEGDEIPILRVMIQEG